MDSRRLESAIAASARAQRHERATVVCPSSIPIRRGRRFYCAAQARDGLVTPFLVTERAHGGLTYAGVSASRAPMLDMDRIELALMRALRANHSDPRGIACPAQMPRQQGLEFVCVATLGAKHSTSFIVRETNSLGRVSFRPR